MNTGENKCLSPVGNAQTAPLPADMVKLQKLGASLGVKVYLYRCSNCGYVFPSGVNYFHPVHCLDCGEVTAKCTE